MFFLLGRSWGEVSSFEFEPDAFGAGLGFKTISCPLGSKAVPKR